MSTVNHGDIINEALQNTPYGKSVHRHYSFIPKALEVGDVTRWTEANFLERVMDISQGAALCMELASASETARQRIMEGEDGLVPTLGLSDTEVASRFAIAALQMLGIQAQERLEHMGERQA